MSGGEIGILKKLHVDGHDAIFETRLLDDELHNHKDEIIGQGLC